MKRYEIDKLIGEIRRSYGLALVDEYHDGYHTIYEVDNDYLICQGKHAEIVTALWAVERLLELQEQENEK